LNRFDPKKKKIMTEVGKMLKPKPGKSTPAKVEIGKPIGLNKMLCFHQGPGVG
jgi:hypothetical protein